VKRSYVWDSKLGKLVEKTKYSFRSHFVRDDIESFVSPIDGSIVNSRSDYREHCIRHDVVNSQEFTPEFYAKKAKERQDFYEGKTGRKERLADLSRAYNKIVYGSYE